MEESQRHVSNHDKTEERTIPPAQQQAMRTEAIAKVDQRISDIALSGSFGIEQRSGIPEGVQNRRSRMKTALAWSDLSN